LTLYFNETFDQQLSRRIKAERFINKESQGPELKLLVVRRNSGQSGTLYLHSGKKSKLD